jgi:hypothetical protein
MPPAHITKSLWVEVPESHPTKLPKSLHLVSYLVGWLVGWLVVRFIQPEHSNGNVYIKIQKSSFL